MLEKSRFIYSTVALLILIACVWFVTSLSNIFTPFFVALALAYICDPIITYLQKRGLPRLYAIILFFIITILLIAGIVLIVAPALVSQIGELTSQTPMYVSKSLQTLQSILDNLHKRFEPHIDLKGMVQTNILELQHYSSLKLSQWIKYLYSETGRIFAGLSMAFNILTALVLIPLYMFFFLKDMDKVADTIKRNIPPRYKIQIEHMLLEIDNSVASFFRGRVIIAIIFTVLSTVGYSVCGVRYSLLFGILFGLATVIPFLSFFVIIPMSIMVFLDTQSLMPIFWIWLVYAINQLLEGFIFTPWILGREVTMHPVTLIMSFLVWGNLLGFLGLLLAVPLTASLKITFRELLSEPFDRLKRGL